MPISFICSWIYRTLSVLLDFECISILKFIMNECWICFDFKWSLVLRRLLFTTAYARIKYTCMRVFHNLYRNKLSVAIVNYAFPFKRLIYYKFFVENYLNENAYPLQSNVILFNANGFSIKYIMATRKW